MDEEWRWVPGFEDEYMVSNLGNVMSIGGKHGSPTMNVLRQQTMTSGYKKVCLSMGKKGVKQVGVHRLVALAFIPNPEHKQQVNHKDGDKTNNRLENLEWVTRSENQLHACRVLGKGKGSRFHAVKLTPSEVIEIFKREGTYAQIGRDYGISATMVKAIKTRKSWKKVTECL